MERLIPLLTPYITNSSKIRLGPPEDGGYVCTVDMLEKCSCIMTYGVGNDIRYEEDFIAKYNKPVFLFDHTIGRTSWEKPNMKFIPEGLGIGPNCKEWYTYKEDYNITGDILLKVDIEGGEYEYFSTTDHNKLRDNIVGLFLEIHWIDDYNNRQKAIQFIEKLNENFLLCHIHGNNWGDLFEYNGFQIPKVLELTFVNKKITPEYQADTQLYPISGLDIPNCPHKDHYQLTFLRSI